MDANTTVALASAAMVPGAVDGGGEIIVQLVVTFIVAIMSAFSYYGLKWLKTSELAKKYQIDTDKLEGLLEKAVTYAAGYGENKARDYASKKNLSIKYLESVDPAMVKMYGDKLETMIQRKAFEMQKTGWIDTDGDGVPDTPPSDKA